MSEAFIPLESRGMRYSSVRRECDCPYTNFGRIRDHRLWLKHEIDKQARELKQSAVADKSKAK